MFEMCVGSIPGLIDYSTKIKQVKYDQEIEIMLTYWALTKLLKQHR